MSKHRLLSEAKKAAFITAVCMIYGIFVRISGIAVPCFFHMLTGALCPSCGITRMFIFLSKLDFYSAYSCNKALFITGPVIAFVLLYEELRYIKTGVRETTFLSKLILYTEAVLLIAFGIARNIL